MLYATPLITAYSLAVTALLGLCMGSFLDCVAWRTVRGEDVARGRSRCSACGHVLAARDLVPVASWLSTGGRCRYCGARIPVRHPLAEVTCCVAYVSVVMRYGLTVEAVEMLVLASALLVLSLTDLDDYLVPNECVVVAAATRLAYVAASGVLGSADPIALLGDSLVGAVALAVPIALLALIMDRVLGRESMGGGDVKLFAVAGLYFGWRQGLFLVMVACLVGIVGGLAWASRAGAGRSRDAEPGAAGGRPIPFGPAIALACWVTALCGPSVVSWYMGLF